MAARMRRRAWLGLAFTGLLGLGFGLGSATAGTQDTQFWRPVGDPYCGPDGNLYQQWCYMDCVGTSCQPVYCQARTVGTC